MGKLKNKINYIEIGKRIKEKRLENNLTQEKLSELVDVSPSYISEIERGTSISSLSAIVKIAEVLNVNLEYLVNGIIVRNIDSSFTEIVENIPVKNRIIYINICKNIADALKES